MHVNRKTLYLGVFLVAAGGLTLIARGEDAGATAARALGLWPLAIIAIGGALILRGTRLALPAGVLAAALPGLLFGSAAIATPAFNVNCGQGNPTSLLNHTGTFDGPASVDMTMSCGTVTLTTRPGSSWDAQTKGDSAHPANVTASGSRLSIGSAGRRVGLGDKWIGDTWAVVLPTDVALDVSTTVNAGKADIDLSNATLGAVVMDINGGDLRLGLIGASIDRLSLDLNAAAASVLLPDGVNFTTSIDVNAGSVSVCVPAGLGLRIHQDVSLGDVKYAGATRTQDVWETPGYASAPNHADVTISVNVGSVDIAPEGGCK
ncbi:MAG: hypothetical protein ABI573_02985 [Chloroflexota bacterium]